MKRTILRRPTSGAGGSTSPSDWREMARAIGRRLHGGEIAVACNALSLPGAIRMYKRDFVGAEGLSGRGLIRRGFLGFDHVLAAQDVNNIATLNYRKGDLK